MPECKNPWITPEQVPAPCGKCMGCLVNRKRLWTHRIMLEAQQHAENSFITLTYDNDHLPENGTLVKKHLQDFHKRLRSYLSPETYRHYSCGEYGDNYGRPHYHCALFGVSRRKAQLIQKAWGKGHTHTGTLNEASAAYIAGYVTKKTKPNKEYWEKNGLLPEYSTMSNGGRTKQGGIGNNAISKIIKALKSEHGQNFLTENNDVPTSLLVSKKTGQFVLPTEENKELTHEFRSYPLGKYLRNKLREQFLTPETIVMSSTNTLLKRSTHEKKIYKEQQKAKAQIYQEMQAMQKDKETDPKITKDAQVSTKHFLLYKNKQTIDNFEKRQSITKKRKVF